ncbi:MAG TPA: hypothetical protein VNI01_13025 [Elusimicrobiota bacterium]|jgi:hypothetical protein|nr:hypothetical protein [Elusimicrobiota bacterium]
MSKAALMACLIGGYLAALISITKNNLLFGVPCALGFGILGGLTEQNVFAKILLFVVGEVLAFFTPIGSPFAGAGFALVGFGPFAGAFMLGTFLGGFVKRKRRSDG